MECILNKVDPQFEPTQGFNYRLSILLCQDGFSFLVTHVVSLRILNIASYKFNQTGIHPDERGGWPDSGNNYFEKLKAVELTQHSYQRVDIAIASRKITIAPYDFINQEDLVSIVSTAYPVGPDEEILAESIFDLGPVTAILIPSFIQEFCSVIFPGAFLHCAAAVFVKGVLRKHSRLISRQIFINMHSGFFEITVIQGLRVIYLNAFRYSASSDVLYYVIFVLEQLGFVPSEENVTLMGDISEQSVIFTQLKMYCESLGFVAMPDEIKYGDSISGTTMHPYFTLLNIPICE